MLAFDTLYNSNLSLGGWACKGTYSNMDVSVLEVESCMLQFLLATCT
jgi:hypothetical protein